MKKTKFSIASVKKNKAANWLLTSVIAFLCLPVFSYGKVSYPSTQRLTPGNVTVGNTITNTDQFYTSLYNAYTFMAIDNDVTLAIDNSITAYMPDTFTCRVKVRVYYKDHSVSTPDSFDKYLFVSYNKNQGYQHQDKQVLHIHGGHYLKVKVLGISRTAVAPYLYLESAITDTYYGNYDASSHPVISSISLNAKNEFMVQWNVQDSAEEYDLEWTFVDDYDTGYGHYKALSAVNYNFEDNATRVTITGTSYKVSNIFEHGYVLFRVRGVARDMVNYTQRINGVWSCNPSGTVSGFSSAARYHITVPYDSTFTWQYSATYAEEGKKKEIVGFMDGSYRNRQTVTKINTDSLAIVGETIYDYQGRGAVQILPVPDTLGLLSYHSNFNKSISGGLYSRTDFDLDGGSCSSTVNAMDSASGAGNYYSTFNHLPSGIAGLHNYFHNYVASAGGYPFTVTEYTPDNTGRIRRQSGVGYDLRMNSGKETKYFYAVPSQEEMDMLFGSSVGFAEHYKKNMVKDANGQVSVSYLNASGKVIATALAGDSTTGMSRLSENGSYANISENLLNTSGPSEAGNSLVVAHTFLVSADNTPYAIDYRMNDSSFVPSCVSDGICYECVYDLTISLHDECGNELLHGNKDSSNPTPLVRTIGKLHADFDTTCSGTPVTYKFSADSLLNLGSDTDFVVYLNTGSYTIIKKLTINSQAADYYTEKYIEENTCIRDLQSFIDEKLDHTDFTTCNYDCSTCLTNLGSKASYRTQWMANLTAAGISTHTHADTVSADERYDSLLARCNALCKRPDPCLVGYSMLKADVSPRGQYAMYDTITHSGETVDTVITDTSSLLNPWAIHNFHSIHDSIYIDGVKRAVSSLRTDEFVNNWQDRWGDSLVHFHPEYCIYHWCEINSASSYYDDSMLNTQSFDSAYAHGYLDPINHDPYFKNGGKGRSQRDTMKGILDDYTHKALNNNVYITSGTSIYSLEQVVIGYIICGAQPDEAAFYSCAHPKTWDSVSCTPYKDLVWQTFRGMYMSQKRQLMEKHRQDSLCGAITIASSKIRRFPTDAQIIASAGQSSTLEDASHSLTNKGNIIRDFDTQADSNCTAYANYWMQKLAGCPFMSKHDSVNVRKELIAVCRQGTDPDNPYGASSAAIDRADSDSFASFQDVLIAHGIFIPGLCDANLITMPQAYGHDYFATQDPKANTCGCNATKILSTDSTCAQVVLYNIMNGTHYSDYMHDPVVTGNSNCACKDNPDDNINTIVNLMRTDVPDSLKCNHCIGCDSLKHAVNRFYRFYSMDSAYMGGIDVDTLPNFTSLLTTYLNADLSFNLSWNDYEAYMAKCVGGTIDTGTFNTFKNAYDNTVPAAIRGDGSGGGGGSGFAFMERGSSEVPVFSSSGRFSPMMMSGRGYMDTCSCNVLFKIAQDSAAGTYGAGTSMQTIFGILYPGVDFPDISAKEKKCQYFLNKDKRLGAGENNPWTPNTKWGPVSTFVMYQDEQSEDLEVPTEIRCEPYGFPSPCSGMMFNCDSLNKYIDGFNKRHTARDTAYMNQFTDSLNAKFGQPGCTGSKISLNSFLRAAKECRLTITRSGGGGCFSSYKKPDCSFMPTPALKGIGQLLQAFAQDTTVVNDSLKLHRDYDAFIYALPYDTANRCINNLYKTILRYDYLSITMEFADSCGFEKELQLTLPDTGLVMDNIINFSNIRLQPGVEGDTINIFYIDAEFYRPGQSDTVVTIAGYSPNIVFGSYSMCDKLCNKPMMPTKTLPDSSCQRFLTNVAIQNATVAYNSYIDSIKRAFRNGYMAKCARAYKNEKFTISHPDKQYHYTLYYYDQGGNLVQTVPPQGVAFITRKSTLDSIDTARKNTALPQIFPNHKLATRYDYNTLNQLVWQHTPDADSSRFWYDRVGRLVVSRNRQQAADGNFSYTEFDALGRITEVGQIHTSSAISYNLVRDSGRLATWLGSGTHSQITRTYYDQVKYTILYKDFSQDNLRSRVVTTTYQETDGTAYDYGTHYSYDIHGNVQALVQQNASLAALGQNYKLMNYDYDLVSGKVNEVYYQKGENDQFYHKYYYDADNRLIQVMTSKDNVIWDEDAAYFYNYHGPLGRMELGDNKVQGIDYAYTIEGWIKGVNSDMLREKRDIGRDGDITLSGNIDVHTARDAFGYSLSYFNGDYKAINASAPKFAAADAGSRLASASHDLFNGNIRNMVTSIRPFITGSGISKTGPMARAFQYDQLNRLINVTAYTNLDTGTLAWKSTGNVYPYYGEHFSYDQNGNILNVQRRGDTLHSGNADMDSMTYHYYYGTNRLKYVADAIDTGWYKTDIDNETDTNNYVYDKIGNLVTDKAGQLGNVTWSVYGKIKSIVRTAGSKKPNLYFAYGPDGNRTMKLVKAGTRLTYFYYIRDAQGNVMAMYKRTMSKASTTIYDSTNLTEQDIYGSARLGMLKQEKLIQRFNYTGSLDTMSGKPTVTTTALDTNIHDRDSIYSRMLGQKRYELSNHLGNVLATVTDRKLQHSANGTSMDYYLPDVLTANDYYAFGAPMPGRSFNLDSMGQNYDRGDTCLTCSKLKQLLAAYSGSLLDSDGITVYLNLTLGVQQTVGTYMYAIRSCNILRDSLYFLASKKQYVSYPKKNQYVIGHSNFTIEAWVSSSDGGNTGQAILSNQAYFSSPYLYFPGILSYLSNHRLYLSFGEKVNGAPSYPYRAVDAYCSYPNDTKWHHVVLERTGTGNNYTDVKIWIDNVSQTIHAETDNTNLVSGNIDSSGEQLDMKVGTRVGSYPPTPLYFDGSIRNVRLYKRALGAAEIDTNYHRCSQQPKDTSNLILWAGIDQAGLTVPDKSVYHNTGYLINFPPPGSWGARTDSVCEHADTLCTTPVTDVSYDTCVTCANINSAMGSYHGSLSDTSAITAHIDSVFHFSKSQADIKGAFYKCKLGNADTLYFDGVSGGGRYVDFGNNTQYKVGTGAFTLEAWVNSAQNDSSQVIMSDQKQYVYSTTFKRFPGFNFNIWHNRLYFYIGDGNNAPSGMAYRSNALYCPMPSPEINKWHHVVAIRPAGSKKWSDITLYIDGMPQITSPDVDNSDLLSANIDSLAVESMKVGSRTGSYRPNYFQGSIREARMYKRVLSWDEIINNYNNGCVSKPWDTTSLVLWAPLDEGTGSTVNDRSHYHATGTITNAGSGYWGSSSSYCYLNTPVLCETHTRHYGGNVIMYKVPTGYRYAFNGKEQDPETYGNNNEYDFGARIYDPRLGRWLSIDPETVQFPGISCYNYCLNSPIIFQDADGKVPKINVWKTTTNQKFKNRQTGKFEYRTITNVSLEQTVFLYGPNAAAHGCDLADQYNAAWSSDGTGTKVAKLNIDGKMVIVSITMHYIYNKEVATALDAMETQNCEKNENLPEDEAPSEFDPTPIIGNFSDALKINTDATVDNPTTLATEGRSIGNSVAEVYSELTHVALHEEGHKMGFDERYVDNPSFGISLPDGATLSPPYFDFNFDFMSSSGTQVAKSHFVDLYNYAIKKAAEFGKNGELHNYAGGDWIDRTDDGGGTHTQESKSSIDAKDSKVISVKQ